jgi:hypothetical protein
MLPRRKNLRSVQQHSLPSSLIRLGEIPTGTVDFCKIRSNSFLFRFAEQVMVDLVPNPNGFNKIQFSNISVGRHPVHYRIQNIAVCTCEKISSVQGPCGGV